MANVNYIKTARNIHHHFVIESIENEAQARRNLDKRDAFTMLN